MPAYNEEDNLSLAVNQAVKVCKQEDLDWEIILVNDGSTDKTAEIARKLAQAQPGIKFIEHKKNKGIGYCFYQGVRHSSKEIITWMPADGENDLKELIKFFSLWEHVDIIIPFTVNKAVRSRSRRLISVVYLWLINLAFGVMFNYTNGTVAYNRRVFDTVKLVSNGFFFQTECLIKSVRLGFIFAEVPVQLNKRHKGKSKALTLKSFFSLLGDFFRLFTAVHILRTAGKVKNISRER
jgi:dolichol-phosphate mannosyltransferase